MELFLAHPYTYLKYNIGTWFQPEDMENVSNMEHPHAFSKIGQVPPF
jgi:hypothetical protein